jgi:hypothetical protein
MFVMVAIFLTTIPTVGAENLNALQLLEAKEKAIPMEFDSRYSLSAGYHHSTNFYVFEVEDRHPGMVVVSLSSSAVFPNGYTIEIYDDKGVKMGSDTILDMGTYYLAFTAPIIDYSNLDLAVSFAETCQWGTPTTNTPPTCTTGGQIIRPCNFCTQTDEERPPRLGHDMAERIGTRATCGVGGVLLHECRRSGCTESDSEPIPAIMHGGSGVCGNISCAIENRQLGDVNGNGNIDVGDALQILRTLVGLSSDIQEGNCAWHSALITPNAQRPTVSDALAILRRLVGLSSALD